MKSYIIQTILEPNIQVRIREDEFQIKLHKKPAYWFVVFLSVLIFITLQFGLMRFFPSLSLRGILSNGAFSDILEIIVIPYVLLLIIGPFYLLSPIFERRAEVIWERNFAVGKNGTEFKKIGILMNKPREDIENIEHKIFTNEISNYEIVSEAKLSNNDLDYMLFVPVVITQSGEMINLLPWEQIERSILDSKIYDKIKFRLGKVRKIAMLLLDPIIREYPSLRYERNYEIKDGLLLCYWKNVMGFFFVFK